MNRSFERVRRTDKRRFTGIRTAVQQDTPCSGQNHPLSGLCASVHEQAFFNRETVQDKFQRKSLMLKVGRTRHGYFGRGGIYPDIRTAIIGCGSLRQFHGIVVREQLSPKSLQQARIHLMHGRAGFLGSGNPVSSVRFNEVRITVTYFLPGRVVAV
ncbi:MAG: hypothetical protein BWY09_00960 [Candidatus Hydrogenedentes bacterium ADurb.Bin179]|nr:MAG: hypothetical protein BWY09_00960 [Candidatus Hydrogenedentes bacterium ADurb.Bin179]